MAKHFSGFGRLAPDRIVCQGGCCRVTDLHQKGEPLVSRVTFCEHKGRRILRLDFSHCKAGEVLPVISEARAVIATQAPKSLYTLTDVTETGFNTEVSDAMKAFVNHNKPFVAAAAVVGVTGLKRIIFNAVVKFSGRKLHAFGSLAEAMDWPAGQ